MPIFSPFSLLSIVESRVSAASTQRPRAEAAARQRALSQRSQSSSPETQLRIKTVFSLAEKVGKITVSRGPEAVLMKIDVNLLKKIFRK